MTRADGVGSSIVSHYKDPSANSIKQRLREVLNHEEQADIKSIDQREKSFNSLELAVEDALKWDKNSLSNDLNSAVDAFSVNL